MGIWYHRLRRRLLRLLLGLVVLVAAHGIALLYCIQPGISLWYPPSGVAIALAFWFGVDGIILTGVATFLMAPIWGLHGWQQLIGLTDAIEPLVGWLLYRRLFKGSLTFDSLKDAAVFTLTVPLVASTSLAMLGNLSWVAVSKISFANLTETIPHWWLGNAIGIMGITPTALLVLTPYLQSWGWLSNTQTSDSSSSVVRFHFSRCHLLEVGTILFLCVGIAFITVFEVSSHTQTEFRVQQLSFLNFAPVIWAATRFGVTTAMLVSTFSILVTLLTYLIAYPNIISLTEFPIPPAILHVHQLSLLVQSFVTLLVGVAITEKAKMQVALAVEKVQLAEYQARAKLSEKLMQLNDSLTEINNRLEESNQDKDKLLQREQFARSEAEKANKLKDEFLAILSHELRTPLNPILGWATLLRKRTYEDDKLNHGLANIERNARLQIKLIEDLLDVSRIQQKNIILNNQPVNLVEILRASLDSLSLAAESKNIQITTIINIEPLWIAGDPSRLQQIVGNLLSNAVKFTHYAGKIEISVQQVDSLAQIQIKDNGKGISPEFLPHVFDYFRQADSTITREFGGLGLGLAIVRQLTELHGGTVKAESPGEGMGAKFTVSFPLMANFMPKNHKAAPVKGGINLANLHILVVDDDLDTGEFLAVVLEQFGAKVTAIASGGKALEVLATSKADLLFSDISMPGIDGYTLMRLIRAMPSEKGGQIPAIALTAYTGELNQKQALEVGFQIYLTKPVEPEQLLQAIAQILPTKPSSSTP